MKTNSNINIPVYSEKEKNRRWQIANRIMEEENVDALLIYGDREGAFPASYAPDTYFTNDRPGSIVIFPKNAEPIAVVFLVTVVEDHIQAGYRNRQGWVRPENIYVGKMGSNVASILEERGMDKSNIGVIGLEPYPPFYFDGPMPYNSWQSIIEDLTEANFKSVDHKYIELTSVKSEEEIEVLKWSAAVGEKMCQVMLEATKPGVKENEVYAAAIAECARNVGYTTELLMGSGPEFIGWGAPVWTYRPEAPRTIEEGDVILAEVFSSFGMLETQHQPTIAVGEVHPDFYRAEELARKSYENGVNALKDGVKFGEVVEAMKIPMREIDNTWHVHPLIHSINPFGLIGTGDRMADLPETKNYAQVLNIPGVGLDTILKKGMVFAMEPNCAIGKHVVNLGGTVIVGQNAGIELNENTTRMMHAMPVEA